MVGDVVITPIPRSDLRPGKPRPAIVIAAVGMSDFIVCPVTAQESGKPEDIHVASADIIGGELEFESWARSDRLHTLHEDMLRRVIGRLTAAKTDEIIAAAANGLLRHLSGSTPPAL